MKRFLSILVALVLIFSFSCNAFAVQTASITVESISASKNDTVSVKVNISNNPGFAAGKLVVNYDKSKLQLVSIKNGLFNGNVNTDIGLINHASAQNVTNNGALCTLQFKVLSNCNTSSTVSLSIETLANIDSKDVPYSVTGGTVSVVHKFGPWQHNDNQHWHVCTICGTEADRGGHQVSSTWSYVDENVHGHVCKCGLGETEAHTWDEGVVTKAATAFEEGEMTYTCSVCQGTKTVAIPKLEAAKLVEAPTKFWSAKVGGVLKFVLNTPFQNFESVLVDGVVLDGSAYSVSGPDLTVELKEAYLKTLPEGPHLILIKTSNGDVYGALYTGQAGQGGMNTIVAISSIVGAAAVFFVLGIILGKRKH